MPLPVRHLPVIQHWDCQGCANCCREYQVSVTDEERRRIAAQGWEQEADIGAAALFERQGGRWSGRYRLAHRPDGACIFLGKGDRCRIHEKFGASAKPIACRLYPFVLVPAGDHWRVGLRFSCPAAARDQGRPVADHRADIAEYAGILEQSSGAGAVPPPALAAGQRVDWRDLVLFTRKIATIVQDAALPFGTRMRKVLALDALCRSARFDKIAGGRLGEFLTVVSAGLDDGFAGPGEVAPPSWVGRLLFRQLLAIYTRKDTGPDRDPEHSRLGLVRAALRFALGRGAVPRLHAFMPETTFERADAPRGDLPPDVVRALERYYTVKVTSLQFCGPSNFHFEFWEGIEALCLTLPVILWIHGVLAGDSPSERISRAIRMVDHNFGFHPLLGSRRQRLGLRILARRGELDKLIAWYSR